MNLDERARATEAVLARYRDKPASWFGANCIRLARAQGVAMGHDLPPVPLFRSALGAKKALAERGFATVTELLDSYFPRLAGAAFMLVGDLCTMPGEDNELGLHTVCISDGRGNLFGYHDDRPEGLATMKGEVATANIIGAWRL